MKKKILSHTSVMIILTVILTFIAASFVMYDKFNSTMKKGVRDEAEYVKVGIEEVGEEYLNGNVGKTTDTRITLTDSEGNVLYDNEAEASKLPNHSNRPEFIQAMEDGQGEIVRYSETLSHQTFYYAVRLNDGRILRLAKTTDSVFHTLLSSFIWLGILMLLIILVEIVLVQRQTKSLIEPVNNLDLEHPLSNVCYEELRPLLMRVDQQNKQIASQLEELKKTEAVRREFSANVSHELKTPLMSISGYAELMMNGMVRPENIADFSGRIYKEANRLGNLVADIIQLSRLDEQQDAVVSMESVELDELAKDVVNNLRDHAEKKNISLDYCGIPINIQGVRHVLYEMLYNIADNAVRYTNPGGHIHIYVGRKGDRPFYRVEDDGIGIPKSEQKRIFERFYRVDKSHSRQTGGTGLGLSIVKHGATLHHAQINVDSDLGKGTKMELLF